MKDVLHVVVGSGNVPFFLNAIQSINNYRAGEIFAVYNYTSSNDKEAFLRVARSTQKSVETLILNKNNTDRRTGSLYWANNQALTHATGKFRFISFVQADMQLMWWSSKIIERAEHLLSKYLQETTDISFYTQLPVGGKRKTPYDGWTWDGSRDSYYTAGHVDVSLMPIFERFNRSFFFSGDEIKLSQRRSSENSRVILHPFPYLAPIPYPSTVRDKHDASRDRRAALESPLLRVSPDFYPDFSSQSFHPITMEDVVFPNRWNSLTPYWPSDTNDARWLKARGTGWLSIVRSLSHVRLSNGRLSPALLRTFVPGFRTVCLSLVTLLATEIVNRLRSRFRQKI